MDSLTIIIASLIILMLVSTVVLKMNLVTVSGIGTVSAIFGGVLSYGLCYFLNPASTVLCATAGAVSSMWSSMITFYFAQAQASAHGIQIGFMIGS